ncbi:MAG: hypothetical protein ACKOC5_13575 [Chloroflexota bacterium]
MDGAIELSAEQVFEVGVTVTRKIDTGYQKYMEYLGTLGGRSPAFGTRENANLEVSAWSKATVAEGQDYRQVIAALIERVGGVLEAEIAAALGVPDVGNEDPYAYQTTKVQLNPSQEDDL